MRHTRRLFLPSSLAFLLLHLASPAPARAWGPEGHEIVTRLAYARLSGSARDALDSLLGIGPQATAQQRARKLSDAANWADSLRADPGTQKWKTWHHTYNWHFVDIPISRTPLRYDAAEDCEERADGYCLIRALDEQRAVLRDAGAPLDKRRNALRFILHLLGDLHQPLHGANDNDRGGNGKLVCFFGFCWSQFGDKNLHSTWDGLIIRRVAADTDAHVARLGQRLDAMSAGEVRDAQEGTPVAWAEDSNRAARASAYRLPAAFVWKTNPLKKNPVSRKYYVIDENNDYYEKSVPVVDEQLVKGALRMQSYLDEALAGLDF